MSILLVVMLRGVSGDRSIFFRLNLHSNMIAIAMSIMSTWWKPRNGINPDDC
jgi:hypothetical protein